MGRGVFGSVLVFGLEGFTLLVCAAVVKCLDTFHTTLPPIENTTPYRPLLLGIHTHTHYMHLPYKNRTCKDLEGLTIGKLILCLKDLHCSCSIMFPASSRPRPLISPIPPPLPTHPHAQTPTHTRTFRSHTYFYVRKPTDSQRFFNARRFSASSRIALALDCQGPHSKTAGKLIALGNLLILT